jgi:mannosyltransferase OCH1-like enzyme
MLLLLFIIIVVLLSIFSATKIPKIIHQLAPEDKTKWNSGWAECQKTWKDFHPEFEYRMWTDEAIDLFMKNEFPIFYNETFTKYPKMIQKVDAVRPFILYKYGGIYADMDYECKKFFYDTLPVDKVSICESPIESDEGYQNALMISQRWHPFWLKLIEDMSKQNVDDHVLESTGPRMISRCIEKNKSDINALKASEYYNGEYARHVNNGTWQTQY